MSGGGVVRGPAGSNDCRIYVGNLPPDIRSKDIEDLFYKYGAIRDIDLKNRRGGPPFAFVQFEDPRWAAPCLADMSHRAFRHGAPKPFPINLQMRLIKLVQSIVGFVADTVYNLSVKMQYVTAGGGCGCISLFAHSSLWR